MDDLNVSKIIYLERNAESRRIISRWVEASKKIPERAFVFHWFVLLEKTVAKKLAKGTKKIYEINQQATTENML